MVCTHDRIMRRTIRFHAISLSVKSSFFCVRERFSDGMPPKLRRWRITWRYGSTGVPAEPIFTKFIDIMLIIKLFKCVAKLCFHAIGELMQRYLQCPGRPNVQWDLVSEPLELQTQTFHRIKMQYRTTM